MTAIAHQPVLVQAHDNGYMIVNHNRLPISNGKRVISVSVIGECATTEEGLDTRNATVIFSDKTKERMAVTELSKNVRRLLGWQKINEKETFLTALSFFAEMPKCVNDQYPIIQVFAQQEDDYIHFYPKVWAQYHCGAIATNEDQYFKKVFEQN